MSYTIRWTTPLNRTERRWLRCWLERLIDRSPGLVERRQGAITVRAAAPETIHAFAALTMAVIGRPRFAYTLATVDGHGGVRAAA
jgi:hypothetical protein